MYFNIYFNAALELSLSEELNKSLKSVTAERDDLLAAVEYLKSGKWSIRDIQWFVCCSQSGDVYDIGWNAFLSDFKIHCS